MRPVNRTLCILPLFECSVLTLELFTLSKLLQLLFSIQFRLLFVLLYTNLRHQFLLWQMRRLTKVIDAQILVLVANEQNECHYYEYKYSYNKHFFVIRFKQRGLVILVVRLSN